MIESNLEHYCLSNLCPKLPPIVHQHHRGGISEPQFWLLLLDSVLSGMLYSGLRDPPAVGDSLIFRNGR